MTSARNVKSNGVIQAFASSRIPCSRTTSSPPSKACHRNLIQPAFKSKDITTDEPRRSADFPVAQHLLPTVATIFPALVLVISSERSVNNHIVIMMVRHLDEAFFQVQ